MILKLPCRDFGNFLFFLPHVRTFWSWSHGFSMALLVLFRGVGQVATLHSHLDALRSARICQGDSATTTEATDVSVGVSAVAGVLLTAGEDSIVKAFDRGNSRETVGQNKVIWRWREKRRDTQPCQKYGSLWVSVWSKKTIVGQSTVLGGLEENIKSKGAGKQPTMFYDILWFLMGDC